MTAIVYGLSISFIILCVVAYNLQVQNAQLVANRMFSGIELRSWDNLRPYRIENELRKNEQYIEEFAWATSSLEDYQIEGSFASGSARANQIPANVRGVTPNVYDALEDKFLDIFMSESGLSLGEQLYTLNGQHGAGIGHNLADNINGAPTRYKDDPSFVISVNHKEYQKYYHVKTTFILNSSPSFAMK